MRKIFGIHMWKDGPKTTKQWRQVNKGVRIFVEHYETPEEYHARQNNMITLLFLGKLFTFRIPFVK